MERGGGTAGASFRMRWSPPCARSRRELGDVDTSAWRWTLTWLEGRPVVELDDGTTLRYDPGFRRGRRARSANERRQLSVDGGFLLASSANSASFSAQ